MLLFKTRTRAWLILFALGLGISTGLFVSGYWLVDFFPIDSRRLLLSTILTGLLGAAGYFALLLWINTRLQNVPVRQQWGLLGASLAVGSFLLFAGTAQWQSPARYLTFFLPSHTLEISTIDGQPAQISMAWFTTSLGDVSFRTLRGHGWERKGDQMALVDSANNQLTWTGKTGENVQIVFHTSSPVKVVVSWDGKEEILEIPPEGRTYHRTLEIPFYASRALIVSLGMLLFAVLSFAMLLVAWGQKEEWLDKMRRSVTTPGKLRRSDFIFLLGVMLLALLLRVPNLGNLYPIEDEYFHLIAARQIVEGVPLQDVYQRSLWLVTFPVSLMFRLFGYQLWAARLVGVVVNVLGLLPLYLLAKKINRPVGILAALLYATSPWIVLYARLVREYAYHPFFFYWIVYGMVIFLEKLPPHFVW
ncbi:MAG: hypothetical protein GXP38_12795, partial [Chloroflexi bacterium]|nr:hypothetical protein [Chloroflexota bacterium]